jgi:DNA polymerase/3'-5' exonuclease PolX
MPEAIPKRLLRSKYRREMWSHAEEVIKRLEKMLPISEVYLRGSFTTKKRRPADVDFIVMLKAKGSKKEKWSVDFVVIPDDAFGQAVIEDADLWMKQKYGAKKSAFVKLK